MTVARRLDLREKAMAAMMFAVSGMFWIVVLSVVGAALYGFAQALKTGRYGDVVVYPVGVALMAIEYAAGLPAYVWIAVFALFYFEWRLGRIETVLWRACPPDSDTIDPDRAD